MITLQFYQNTNLHKNNELHASFHNFSPTSLVSPDPHEANSNTLQTLLGSHATECA